MNLTKIPTPEQLFHQIPLTREEAAQIDSFRKCARHKIHCKGAKPVVILGPCSIHSFEGALSYAKFFQTLQEEFGDTLFLVMRVHVEKPRTRLGWKGFVSDPHLDHSDNITEGLTLSRKLMHTLTQMGIPIATELLDPLVYPYFSDLITWGTIGARTISSQPHRQLSSLAPFPVGMKNSIEGSIQAAINAMVTASHPHTFLYPNNAGQLAQITSTGNPDTHLILRGSDSGPNVDQFKLAASQLEEEGLSSRILIDCGHGNSGRKVEEQIALFERLSVMRSPHLLGFMLESYIEGCRQSLDEHPLSPTKSVTDPCIDARATEEMISHLARSYQHLPNSPTLYH